MILDIDLGSDLLKSILQHGGVESWNQWINDLADTGILNPECSRDSDPAMLVGFDLSHADLAGLVMPGIDLSWCHIAHASFRGCDLTGAKIAADITRVDFTDTRVDGLILEDCGYEQSSPPLGLPDHLLTQCKEDDVKPVRESTRLHTASVGIRGRLIFPRPSKPPCVATR